MAEATSCQVDPCDRTQRLRRGVCNEHYGRDREPGDPNQCNKVWSYDGQLCSVADCESVASSRGWCDMHYERWRRTGSVETNRPVRVTREGDCLVGGCMEPRKGRGLCAMHYQRWRVTGEVGSGERMTNKRDPNATEKACSLCKTVKPLDHFHIEPRARDGRWSQCKACYGAAVRDRRLHKKYGISAAEYDAINAEQCGLCRICRDEPDARGLVVDHCHKSGKFRGLVCNNCNALLGMANDDIKILLAAIEYLEIFT